MRIAFFSTKAYDQTYFDKHNIHQHELIYFDAPLNEQTVYLTKEADAVCAFVNDKLNAEVIEQLSILGVKCILLRCAGFNNVDISAAKKHQIKVYRVPAYSPNSVAEHAVALILTLNRKTHKAYNRVREGNFSLSKLEGFDLFGKTVGVIGTGLIGTVFCKIMLGFGCKVIANSPVPNEELVQLGVTYVSNETLFKNSNIISIHAPLTSETQHLINEKSINLMKDGVMIINTSRGGLIDTKAIISALKSHKIGYLGIDVYEQEAGLFFSDWSETIIQDEVLARLQTFPNVLITAHQGFFTNEALNEIAKVTLENAEDFKNNLPSEKEVL